MRRREPALLRGPILFIVEERCFSVAQKPKTRRRRRFNLRRVRVSPQIILSTLGSVTAITSNVTGSADGQYRAVTLDCSWAQNLLTAGEGPVTVGYAHSDYSVTEIKEAIEIAAGISVGDKIAQEKANRLVRIVGTFESDAQSVLNDGRRIKTRLNWLIPIGKSVNIFAYNEFASALATGCVIHLQGDMWVKDV